MTHRRVLLRALPDAAPTDDQLHRKTPPLLLRKHFQRRVYFPVRFRRGCGWHSRWARRGTPLPCSSRNPWGSRRTWSCSRPRGGRRTAGRFAGSTSEAASSGRRKTFVQESSFLVLFCPIVLRTKNKQNLVVNEVSA